MRKTQPVHAFGAADVGRAKTRHRNGFVGGQAAGHAGHPEHFVANGLQAAVGELVNLGKFAKRGVHAAVHASDQLDLRLTEVGGDAGVCQGRAQGRRMRGQCQTTRGQRTQAFFFNAARHAQKAFGAQCLDAGLQIHGRRSMVFYGGLASGRRSALLHLVVVICHIGSHNLQLPWKVSQARTSR